MTEITVLRPDEPEPVLASLTLAPRRALTERPVVGLVANGKPLATELLAIVAQEMGKRLELDVDVELLKKPSAAYQISAEEADVLAARSHVVITGVGD